MAARLIDGKREAQTLRARVAAEAAAFAARHGLPPGLAAVLVGEDPASQVYVGSKTRAAGEAGLRSFTHRLPAGVAEDELLALLARLNADETVHGILVQLPLPQHMKAERVLRTVDPPKDVDGFHPLNAGLLAIGEPALVPCTPAGCLRLIKTVASELRGLEAVVVGRSTIVGRPLAQLLLREDCTVTVAHSHTRDLPAVCRRADILVAAVGRPEMVKADWIRPGAIVIDVGINRIQAAGGKARVVGDVAFAEACEVAGAITPVPGGVGPMTVASLLANTLRCARLQREG
jgi:methylenetetrahydrofolate dehydrogenase (NADP+)/methenyltetrahydrofolate cyclohydrolase